MGVQEALQHPGPVLEGIPFILKMDHMLPQRLCLHPQLQAHQLHDPSPSSISGAGLSFVKAEALATFYWTVAVALDLEQKGPCPQPPELAPGLGFASYFYMPGFQADHVPEKLQPVQSGC